MNILINGMGNIGTTLANLISHYKSDFGIDNIYLYKRSIFPWNKSERSILESLGILICSENANASIIALNTIIDQIDYIFEAAANGVGLSNLEKYSQLPNLKASNAQGSEKGYGIPFMSGINDDQIKGEKFVNIVSCNTHGTASLLTLFAGKSLENLKQADIVVVRRSEDLGNHARLVSGNVIARHLSPTTGTHHAIDVVDLFKTIGVTCPLTSSDITTPSQLTHSVRFNIELNHPLNTSVESLIDDSIYVSKTYKFDSNVIFELGRRYGFQGRLYSHAIIVIENLLHNETCVKGWAFVPQEGNSIISSLHAFMLQMELTSTDHLLKKIQTDLIRNEW